MGAVDSPFTVVIIMTRDTHAYKLLLLRGKAASKVTATNENIGSLWPESDVGPTLRAPLSGTVLQEKDVVNQRLESGPDLSRSAITPDLSRCPRSV